MEAQRDTPGEKVALQIKDSPMTLFALVDCNNFYVSCERVFAPRLNGKPVIVLSNNDGCAVARSNEAKALGIGMGQPFFEIQHLIEANQVKVFSSNYPLYGDMSTRVMNTLTSFTPAMEIYSIDEAFLDLTNFAFTAIAPYARKIVQTVKRDTGIPVSIGIGPTKTLAKIANRIAKKSSTLDGVLDLTSERYQKKALEITSIDDVWGIGRRLAPYFKYRGLHTAADFLAASPSIIKKKMGINGIRMQKELAGESCYPLEACPAPRKSVRVSRSFKTPLTTVEELMKAISMYVSRGAEKIRAQCCAAESLTVFVMTSRFKSDAYYKSRTVTLPTPSSHTPELIKVSRVLLKDIFQHGRFYTKAGIMFPSLVRKDQIQLNLFDTIDRNRSYELMKTLDRINEKMGSYRVRFAAMGLTDHTPWKGACNHRSPEYTTRWSELLQV